MFVVLQPDLLLSQVCGTSLSPLNPAAAIKSTIIFISKINIAFKVFCDKKLTEI